MFERINIIILDLETAHSADDCLHCGYSEHEHMGFNNRCYVHDLEAREHGLLFTPIGWSDKGSLGLSIGGYYSYRSDRIFWFNEANLEETTSILVDERPLMVSFNGMSFDFALIRAMLRQKSNECHQERDRQGLEPSMCMLDLMAEEFESLAANSYDILAEIWRADPDRRFERGLNSLDAISQANGLGPKLSHGAQAPRDWQAGKHADVINYCSDDIYKTKELFERLTLQGGRILRGDGSTIGIRWIDSDGEWREPIATYV